MTSLWERLELTATSARLALSAQRIVETAVRIADADGLDAITMRRLATELGVTPRAAYRHVSGKEDVLELMVDFVYGEVDVPDDTGWRETMQALATGIRTLVLKHPWLARLSAPQMVYELTPNRMALAEKALTALGGLESDPDTTMSVFRTVFAYVHGATSAEIGLRQLMDDRGWTSGAETRIGLSAQMNWLMDTGRYPAFKHYIHNGARKDDLRWQFETGLEHVLDGIAAGLGRGGIQPEGADQIG